MKQPNFWKKKSALSLLLYPLAIIYRFITAFRAYFIKPYTASIPVICVGNVTVGGAGKTPTAIALCKIFKELGKNPVFLSRGYGGNLQGPEIVNSSHTSSQTGDEPLLLARYADTIISKDRKQGAILAESRNYDVVIMDDGFQNPSIRKTLSLLVIDGNYGIGNGFVMPSGPLREPLSRALARTDAAIIIGNNKHNISLERTIFNADIAVSNNLDKSKKYIAFAGIANNEKFFSTLRQNNFDIIEEISFDDHYQYSAKDIEKLKTLAQEKNCPLITTEKDLVRIEKNNAIKALAIELKFENEEPIKEIIKALCEK